MTYSCKDHAPFATERTVQDGHWDQGEVRKGKLIKIKDDMSKDCKYSLSDLGKQDGGCDGCEWRQG